MHRLLPLLCTSLALAAPATATATRHFLTQGPNRVTCDMDARSVSCLVESPQVPLLNAMRVTITPDARLSICHGIICLAGSTESAPVLVYGRSIAVAPFRCTATRAGARCVVTKSGRGFQLGAAGIKRIQL